jgi:hypothetical protein
MKLGIGLNQKSNPFIDTIAYYRFDESSGNAIDLINNHNGTVVGGVTRNASGKLGDAYEFNGTNSYVQLPPSLFNSLDYTNFTVCFWFKVLGNKTSSFEGIISDDSPVIEDTKLSISLQNSSGRIFFGYSDGTTINGAGSTLIPIINQFYFLQYKYLDNESIVIKVNNEVINTLSVVSSPSATNPISVGARANQGQSPSLFFEGIIGDLFFINGQTDEGQDKMLYNNGNGVYYNA